MVYPYEGRSRSGRRKNRKLLRRMLRISVAKRHVYKAAKKQNAKCLLREYVDRVKKILSLLILILVTCYLYGKRALRIPQKY